MKLTLHVISLFVLLLSGCSPRLCPVREEVIKDTVNTTTRIMTHVELVPVLVKTDIPDIGEMRCSVADSVDVIENDYAVSTVVIHGDGTVDHALRTKPQTIETDALVPVTVTDSTIVSEHTGVRESSTVEIREVNVLKTWQKVLIWMGAGLLALLVAFVAYQLFKHRLRGIQSIINN